MAWLEKGQFFALEHQPISGLYFLDGDIVGQRLNTDWIKGQKYPLMAFPSGVLCQVWESRDPDNAIVHVFGEMDLPLKGTADSAFQEAKAIAEQVGYVVHRDDAQTLRMYDPDEDEHVRIIFDNEHGIMQDIVRTSGIESQPHMPLLDDELRAKLPPLFTTERIGLTIEAQVKFFTPALRWTWYASEASAMLRDGTTVPLSARAADDPDIEDIMFCGLVDGDELGVGYFSLRELEKIGNDLGMPMERDRFYKPTPLKDLAELHEKLRERGNGHDTPTIPF